MKEKLAIKNKVFDFKNKNSIQIFIVMLSVELRFLLWNLFSEPNDLFFVSNYIKNLKLRKWHTYFYIGQYTYKCLTMTEEERKINTVTIIN